MTIVEETIKLLSEINEPLQDLGEVIQTFKWESWDIYVVARTSPTLDGVTRNAYFLMKKGNESKIANNEESLILVDFLD